MKITSKILNIPPYLSTTWKNIVSLQTAEKDGVSFLIVLLQNKTKVEIPNLDGATIEQIFNAHALSLEQDSSTSIENAIYGPFTMKLPMPFNSDSSTIDSLASSLQHNPIQENLPPLAEDILKKISKVARAFGLDDLSVLPTAKEDCNCLYCQVVRSMNHDKTEETEEEISDQDLKFRSWNIQQTADKLYLVTNPLDANEHYNVYLGDPIGCTCGKKHCEHIKEVLST